MTGVQTCALPICLGLAIVKHAALVHGGSVDLESERGVGSTFIIELPQGLGSTEIDEVSSGAVPARASSDQTEKELHRSDYGT